MKPGVSDLGEQVVELVWVEFLYVSELLSG